ncbi:peptidylprolyl isomerase [Geomesophilobacter sediminis]|uniref:peptidylprolyl isomerase n=1 Tax=Geomesophilobacter sediminis TaxID=2798584 RepID=A0A8J7M4G9_9BACT|nr:peptidyl-prolyl cis-trans isomerase [Geomesophilobacter sediminis]MBJ6727921.1 peptidylprolyl isomerase [Geomesophilobacter sediminis]
MSERRKRTAVTAVVAFLALICLAGCNKPGGADRVLAQVNDIAITQKDLETGELVPGHIKMEKKKDLDYVITEELFYQEGKRIGLDHDPSYRKQLARLEASGHGTLKDSLEHRQNLARQMRSEMARRVFDTQIAAKVEVRMPEAREYFDRNREKIRTELHLGLIRYGEKEQAAAAVKKLAAGASFEDLARAQAKGKGGAESRSWDLGYVRWRDLPIDFVAPLYRLKPGEVSGILGNNVAGFQLVKLYEARKSTEKTEFEAISGVIMNGLRDLKLVEAHQKYVEQLRRGAKIVTF